MLQVSLSTIPQVSAPEPYCLNKKMVEMVFVSAFIWNIHTTICINNERKKIRQPQYLTVYGSLVCLLANTKIKKRFSLFCTNMFIK